MGERGALRNSDRAKSASLCGINRFIVVSVESVEWKVWRNHWRCEESSLNGAAASEEINRERVRLECASKVRTLEECEANWESWV